jgi:flagellar hook-associated protein 3 FlgL
MRVGSSSIYNNFMANQQKNLSELLKVNNQISSGKKIQFGYQDTTTYQDTLRLINEKATLNQVSDTTQKARTHSDNSDVAISQIKESLETFKVKLTQAANDVHSPASYRALAGDLQALKLNILDVANTSINGNFLFSGTNMKQKPFDETGAYHGNDQRIYAQAGDRLEIPYNIDGKSLMMGMDESYAKRMTTNVTLLNQTELNHRVLSKTDPYGVDTEVPIKGTDSIRDLIGQPDDSAETHFYMRGQRPDGESFKARVALDNFGTVNDLLEQIGRQMGNTAIFEAVDVTLGPKGHIEIKDIKSGRMLTDFHMVASNAAVDDVTELTGMENAKIFEFNKSNYAFSRTSDEMATKQDYYDPRRFDFGVTLRRQDSEAIATKYDTVQSVMGENVDEVAVSINGNERTYGITIATTIEDLMASVQNDLQNDLGGKFDVDIQRGKIGIFDLNASHPDTPDEEKIPSQLDGVNIRAQNSAGEAVHAFATNDALGYDRARFEKEGALLTAAVSQVKRADSQYATAETQLIEVAGTDSLDEKRFHLEGLDINGDRQLVEITLRDTPDENGRLSTFQVIEPAAGEVYDIYDKSGKQTTAGGYDELEQIPYADGLERHEQARTGVTYQQLFNVMGMALSGNLPQDDDFDSWSAAVAEADKQIDIGLNRSGEIEVRDLTTSQSKMQVSLYDADTDRFDPGDRILDKGLLQTYTGTKGEPGWDIQESRPNRPLSEVAGFNFSGGVTISGTDINGNAATVTLNETNTLQELRDAIDTTFGDGPGNGGFVTDVIDGRLIVRDNTNPDESPVEIDFLFNDAAIDSQRDRAPAMTFMANNALTIDEPRVDIFEQLDMAIQAVYQGQTRPDGNSETAARSIGIQNAIYALDHIHDHVNQIHTQNGSVGIALELTYEKSEMMELNVSELKSMVLDADIGEAIMKMNQRTVAYQALLSTIGRINQLSLVNYLR